MYVYIMFTGIVTAIGRCTLNGSQMTIFAEGFSQVKIGESVAVDGVCLTVTNFGPGYLEFFVMQATFEKAHFKEFVNLERSIRYGDDNSGHLISGHINARGEVISYTPNEDTSFDLWIKSSLPNLKYKDGIAINGTSLTIAEVNTGAFKICIIPYTHSHTTMQYLKAGDLVNIEYGIVDHHEERSYMQRALQLAEKGRNSAPPNPWVGCVIVHKDQTVIGEGYHVRPGEDHAEVVAIKDAIKKGNEKLLPESTLYVTLEPCHHTGRTPPCDQYIMKHGIKKVVISCLDPDPKVNGSGIQFLQENGVEVTFCMEEEGERLLAPYIHHRKTGLPYCILKAAISIDGCIATETGDSKWISSEASRSDVQRLRAESQAIIVGAATVLADNPRLNVRDFPVEKQPLRVVFDGKGRVSDPKFHVFDTEKSKTLIFGKTTLRDALKYLGSIGILQCLIEGGAEMYTSFLEEGLVQEACFYHANLNLGGTGKRWLMKKEPSLVKEIHRWKLIETKKMGDSDIFARYLIPAKIPDETKLQTSVEEAIEAIKSGKPVIVMDHEERENEGDLIVAAEFVTSEMMAFFMNYTTGMICVSMTEARAKKLSLPMMVSKNEDPRTTNFTISCDAAQSKTGISAAEKAGTILNLANDNAEAMHFHRPGHIFPLVAHKEGLHGRRGHTEASLELCDLAGVRQVAALAELMNNDGTPMNFTQCSSFAKRYGIPLISVDDLMKKISPKEVAPPSFNCIAESGLTIRKHGDWTLKCYESGLEVPHRVLVKNLENGTEPTLVRIHSECFTGDTFGSLLCDCREQLDLSMEMITKKGSGVIIMPAGHEGRGIGLVNKIRAYHLMRQSGGKLDTFEANRKLGFEDDLRDYSIVPLILDHLGIEKIEILTNNVKKIECLKKYIVKITPLVAMMNPLNEKYIKDKTEKYGYTKQIVPENTIHVDAIESDKNLKMAILSTSWHQPFLSQVEEKIIQVLQEYKISAVEHFTVPGSFELPLVAKILAAKKQFDAIICLGLILKGETAHFDYISSATIHGLADVQLSTEVPIINGVLNCYELEQARARCHPESGYGASLAKSAVMMARFCIHK